MRLCLGVAWRPPCRALISAGQRCPGCAAEHRRAANARRTATSPYRNPQWRRTSRRVLDRDGRACVLCGSTRQVMAHHVVRRQDGGPDDETNAVTLCRPHHDAADAALLAGTDAPILRLVRAALADAIRRSS